MEAGDEFFGEGFAGLSPEEAAGDAAVFFHGEGEGEEHFDVLLDALLGEGFEVGGGLVGGEVFEGDVVEDPWRVESEVDADVAVLLKGGVVEAGAEAEEADGGGLELPEWVEAGVGVGGEVWRPEVPAHFELVGHVVVELLGGFGDGVFDEGVGGIFGAVVGDVDALVGGGFSEADGVYGGSGDTLGLGAAADAGKLVQDGDERGGERLKAEVGEPEAKVELIGHRTRVQGGGSGVQGWLVR